MFSYSIIFLLVIGSLNCVFKHTIHDYSVYTTLTRVSVSEKVGEAIDTLECTQYNLFRGIEKFESAIFFEMLEGGYVVEITTAEGKYRVVNHDNKGIEIMRAYIDDYEERQEKMAKLMKNRRIIRYIRDKEPIYEKIKDPFESEWHIVDYDDLGLPITKHEIKKFYRKTNTYVYGASCCLSSSLIGGGFTVMALMDDSYTGSSKAPIVGIISAGAAIGSAFIGKEIGKSIDNREIIEAIKQARKPKKFE
jgi:hypothetical protein